MRRNWRSAVAALTAAAMAAAPVADGVHAQTMSRADYEACQAKDEASFKAAIERITVQALQQGVGGVDFKAIVTDEWRKGTLDELIDKRVDLAVAEVRQETSLGSRLKSLIDKDTAQNLANAVAERAYRSDAIKSSLETLSTGVGTAVGRRMELAIIDAAKPTLQCLEAYLGPRYGSTIARTMAQRASAAFEPQDAAAQIGTGSLVYDGKEGIAGAAVLLVRRQLANMASRMGQRVIGSVLGRLVSVVAGGIGLVLIGLELKSAWDGAFPIISTEMKSADSKDKVRSELASAMSQQVSEQTREIGAEAAKRIVDVWQELRRAHAKTLELAEAKPAFRKLLDTTRPDSLSRLDEVVALVLAGEGVSGIDKRLGDGTLHQAVNVLPKDGMQIARDTRSIDAALKWWGLAGADLNRVIAYELPRRAKPEDFTKVSLQRLFALDDRLAIARLAGIDAASRDAMFDLKTADLKTLLRSLTEPELETLASYLTGLGKVPREQVLSAVAKNPGKMQLLASARVRDAIVGSSDQEAAVAMMLRDRGFDLPATRADVENVLAGKINPVLLWDRHPVVLIAAGVLALILLLIIRRILFSGARRRRPPAPPAPSEAT